LRASVGSTDASASLLARVGVVGPTRAGGEKGDSPTVEAHGPCTTLRFVPFPTTLQPPGEHRQADLVVRARDEQTIAVGHHRDRPPV
jgi:hypothetical protein